MVQLVFLLSTSLALLLGQRHVLAESLPAGQHTITIYKKHHDLGSCRYIYYVDDRSGNPKYVDNELCENYAVPDHSFKFETTSKKTDLLVIADCTDGESIVYIQRKSVTGTEGPYKAYEEIFSGPICVQK